MNPRDMNDEQLRVRVATILGWTKSTWREQGYSRGATDGEVWLERGSKLCRPLYDDDDGGKYPFPRFPYDLDAAHFMESHIPLDKEAHYGRLLEFIVARDKNGLRAVWHATARQRSEAFVETMEGQ